MQPGSNAIGFMTSFMVSPTDRSLLWLAILWKIYCAVRASISSEMCSVERRGQRPFYVIYTGQSGNQSDHTAGHNGALTTPHGRDIGEDESGTSLESNILGNVEYDSNIVSNMKFSVASNSIRISVSPAAIEPISTMMSTACPARHCTPFRCVINVYYNFNVSY